MGLRRWWKSNREWVKWKVAHPRGRYHEFYVEQVSRRLDDGVVHVSLGEKSVEDERHEEAGRMILDVLSTEGLEPHHKVVDYGCGSLRIGRKLIEYLEPGRYVGLDVTDRFFTEGLRTLAPELVAAKSPELAVITDDELARRATQSPDWVISVGVLIHVPRSELDPFLDRCLSLSGPDTRTRITFFEGAEHVRLSDMTWAWQGDFLVEEVTRRGFQADHVALDWPLAKGSGREKRVLRISRRRAPVRRG